MAANFYLQQLFDDYKTTAKKALKTFEKDFKSCMNTHNSFSTKLFRSMESKLLPLHGYPLNNNLLAQLEEEIVQKTAGLGFEWDASLKNFKVYFKHGIFFMSEFSPKT